MKLNDTKHIWLPALLTVYAVIMAFLGRDMLLVKGDYLQFFSIIGIEAAAIIGLSYFLRRKYQLKHERELQAGRLEQHSSDPTLPNKGTF